jgi:Cu/Ag efflux protein CusF
VGKAAGPDVGSGAFIARAPKGDKPGVIIANTDQTTVKIDAVDADNQTVTFEGQSEPVKVAKDVDLSSVKKGDQVSIRLTRGVALWVEKPQDAAQTAAGTIRPQGVGAAAGIGQADTTSATATVEAIDPEQRIVTLKTARGDTRKIQLGKEAINFDQIAVGDKVRATLAEEVAIAVSKGDAQTRVGDAAVIARAPRGAKPNVLIAESSQVKGKIQSIDAAGRTITLADADGKPRTIKAGPKIDLADLKAGDDVTARVTQALAIVVEKP